MHLIVTKDANEMALLLSKIVIGLIKQKQNPVLGLATGSTPIATYQLLSEDYQKNKTDWSNVSTFNLDEYVGIEKENPNSYHYFMEEQLFKNLNIKKENIHIPNGLGDVAGNACAYEALINQYRPIDFQILGIGSNGHIGFNEPGSDVNSLTRVVKLSPTTMAANRKNFINQSVAVPTQAITMGIATILRAKNIVLIATGENKAIAIKALVQGPVSKQWPCSFLQNHPSVIIIVDQAAASLLDQTKIKERE